MSNGYLTGCALLFSIVITIMILFKKSVKNIETNIFRKMLILNIFESLTTTLIVLAAGFNASTIVFEVLNRIDVILIISWCSLLFYYICVISNDKDKKIVRKSITIINIVMYIISLFLSVEIIIEDGILDSTGPLTYFGLGCALFYIFLMFIVLLFMRNTNNKLTQKKYIPLYILIFLLIIIAFLRVIIPQINFISILLTLVDLIMSSTIENPDLKMIEQLERNRTLIERSNTDKSNFLFRMSQEVKKPIDDISKANKNIELSNDIETIKKYSKYINYNTNELKSLINGVFDISRMDTYNIKILKSTYNVYNVFMELFTKYSKKVNENVDFRYNISNSIPKILYGDHVKLKQVVTTILENSIKYTKHGFIDINIDSIIKNSVCRLIISIEDSGIGMSIDKVNELLSVSESLTDAEIKEINNINLNINIATKILRMLGGQLIIKSEENVGSEFIIILEQKIKNENDYNEIEYNKYSNKKRVLIINDKQDELNTISDYLEKNKIETVKLMYAGDCVDKIKNNEKFDIIIMDDEMNPVTGINLLQQLKKINDFKIPVVILLDKNKESIKEHYLNDGFTDFILKSNLIDELDKIIKKFI